jgi:hypothetical protein
MNVEWLITNPEYKVANRDAKLEVLRIRTVADKRMITLVWKNKRR